MEFAHNGAPAAHAFAEYGTAQLGLIGGMAAHGLHAFLSTPFGCVPSRM
jgi:hypothetical protein